ncbi:hypothetical protein BDW72DRAFT_189058 [Aspergillus terricola var. indicus]
MHCDCAAGQFRLPDVKNSPGFFFIELVQGLRQSLFLSRKASLISLHPPDSANMLHLLSFVLCTLSAARVVGYSLNEPLYGATCFTNDFTIRWEIESDEYVTAFTAEIVYSDGSSTTATTFSPMDMESSTVLPAKFLPALRPEETSDIDFFFYTLERGSEVGYEIGYFITDIALVAPTPTTATVTVTSKDSVTITATSFLAAEASATDSETSATVVSGSESKEDHNGGGGLSDGAKAGIGVGVGAGLLVIITAGGLLWFRYQRQRKEDRIPVIGAPASDTLTRRPLSEPEAKTSILPSFTPEAAERPRDGRYEMQG